MLIRCIHAVVPPPPHKLDEVVVWLGAKIVGGSRQSAHLRVYVTREVVLPSKMANKAKHLLELDAHLVLLAVGLVPAVQHSSGAGTCSAAQRWGWYLQCAQQWGWYLQCGTAEGLVPAVRHRSGAGTCSAAVGLVPAVRHSSGAGTCSAAVGLVQQCGAGTWSAAQQWGWYLQCGTAVGLVPAVRHSSGAAQEWGWYLQCGTAVCNIS